MNKTFLTIILLAAAVYIVPLNVRPLSVPDETRYAEIPREMIASGDWVVPRLNGLLYFEKPVLGYWLNAISILIFGENNFAVRLPSAISALLSALLTFLLVRKFSGDERKALLSAAALLSCVLVFAIGIFNVLDSLFSFLVTATMVSFFFAAHEPDTRRQKLLLILCGISCGLAFLTKGFLAFAFPVVVIVPFLLWEKRFKDIFVLPWIPAITALLVIMPWAVLVHLRNNDYWYQFFWVEHVQRFFSPAGKAQHAEPPWYFIPFIIGGIFPWIMLLPASIAGMWRRGFSSPLNRFAACWLSFLFLFLSASSGKLGTYILPCFPPMIILLIEGLMKHLEDGRRLAFRAGAISCSASAVLLAIAAIVTQGSDLMPNLNIYYFSETWKWMSLTAGLLVLGLLTAISAMKADATKRILLYSASPLLLFFALHFAVPSRMHERSRECMDSVGMMRLHSDRISPDSIIVADSYLVPAACWAYKIKDIYLFGSGGEMTYGLQQNNKDLLIDHPEEFQEFINLKKVTVTLILNSNDYRKWESILPKPSFLSNMNGLAFVHYQATTVPQKEPEM